MTLSDPTSEQFIGGESPDTEYFGLVSGSGEPPIVAKNRHIIEEKLRIPDSNGVLTRPRLIDLLDRAGTQAPATLLCGRAGTGKTLLAAEFTTKHDRSIWYSIEPADTDWDSFSAYLTAAIFGKAAQGKSCRKKANIDKTCIAEFLARCINGLQSEPLGVRRLFVLDNLHHLYDAEWFPDFFNYLISSLPLVPGTHLLMLCRSTPNLPLWRMRSKQVLNVIDENVLAVTASETVGLCRLGGLPVNNAAIARSRSNGRISSIVRSIQQISAF